MRIALVVMAVIIVGCARSAQEGFLGPSSLRVCEDEVPVCNTTAGCKLVEEDHYVEGNFPGRVSFIVPTEGEAVVRVRLFWVDKVAPGADTEIIWHEPACVDRQTFESEGSDVFTDSDNQGVFTQEARLFRAGEHLVEVRSDATSGYVLRPEVLTAAEHRAEQEQQGGIGFP